MINLSSSLNIRPAFFSKLIWSLIQSTSKKQVNLDKIKLFTCIAVDNVFYSKCELKLIRANDKS